MFEVRMQKRKRTEFEYMQQTACSWHVWGLGCASNMYLPLAWEILLHKSNTQTEQNIFAIILVWASSYASEQTEVWKIPDTYTVMWSLIEVASIVIMLYEEGQHVTLPVAAGRTTSWQVKICSLQICFCITDTWIPDSQESALCS